MSENSRFHVHCPECGAELFVDRATGAVVHARKPSPQPPAGGKSFEALFAELEEKKLLAEQRFEQERRQFEDRERILQERFEEALRRAEEEPDLPPKRPFDLD